MNDPTPHYLLTSEASRTEGFGRWRFVLRAADGSAGLEAADVEPDVWGERLDLLTVIRALESLDRPSRVTVIGCTRYVEQGVLYGVPEWRHNGWRWEYFGKMVPVRDADLWQRMDHVLQFHRVDCGQRRFDAGHGLLGGPHWGPVTRSGIWVDRIARSNWLKYYVSVLATWCGVCMEIALRVWQKLTGFRVQGSGFST
jgi:ribonuclease HI